MSQAESHLIDSKYSVDHSGGGTHSYEAVHVGRSIPKSFKTDLIILIVEIHNGQSEQQLSQAKCHRILVAQ